MSWRGNNVKEDYVAENNVKILTCVCAFLGDILKFNSMIVKMVTQIIVLVLNYVISKLVKLKNGTID